MHNTDVILRPKVTAKIVGLGDRQIRIMEAAGKFPKRFKLFDGGKAVGHLGSEVQAWVRERAASRDASSDAVELKAAEEYDAETLDSEGDEEGGEEGDEEEDTET